MYLEIIIKNLNSLVYLFHGTKSSREWFPVYGTKDKVVLTYRENRIRKSIELSYNEAVDMIREETNKLQLPVEYSQSFNNQTSY